MRRVFSAGTMVYTVKLAEIKIYKSQVTKIQNSPICDYLSTTEMLNLGMQILRNDDFSITEGEQYDI